MIVIERMAYIGLPVLNIRRAVEFYTSLLDFEAEEENEQYAVLSLDDHYYLKLVRIDRAALPEKRPKVPVLSFKLDVDDFSDAITELESKEIRIVEGPITTSKGESLLFQDPSGNLIEIYYEEEE